MLIGIEKYRATKNGYRLGRFVGARSFAKRISNDYFLKYRNFICDESTKKRIEKLLKRARRAQAQVYDDYCAHCGARMVEPQESEGE